MSVTYELKDIRRTLNALDPAIVKKARRSANLKTTRKARTFISKGVRSKYAGNASRVKRGVSLKTVNQGQMTQNVLVYVGHRIGLINFVTKSRANAAANRTKSGKHRKLSVRIRKDSGRKTIYGFVAIGRSGNTHVFARTGAPRMPIRALKTISIPEMVNTAGIQDSVNEFVGKEYPVQFEHELEYFLSKATGQ